MYGMMTLRALVLTAAIFGTVCPVTSYQEAAAQPADTVAEAVVTAPFFSGKSLQGVQLSSDKLMGRGYIVNFFASWCPYCRSEIAEMVALQKKYESKGFTFIGMAYKDNDKSMHDLIWEYDINYPVIMADRNIINAFSRQVSGGVHMVPLLFAVGRDGKLLVAVPGVQTKDELEHFILQTLQSPVKK